MFFALCELTAFYCFLIVWPYFSGADLLRRPILPNELLSFGSEVEVGQFWYSLDGGCCFLSNNGLNQPNKTIWQIRKKTRWSSSRALYFKREVFTFIPYLVWLGAPGGKITKLGGERWVRYFKKDLLTCVMICIVVARS